MPGRPMKDAKFVVSATTYCLPPILNCGTLCSVGDMRVRLIVTGALVPPAVFTTTCTGPVAVSSGMLILICVGLT